MNQEIDQLKARVAALEAHVKQQDIDATEREAKMQAQNRKTQDELKDLRELIKNVRGSIL